MGSVPFLAYADPEPLVEGIGDRLANPLEAVVLLVVALPVVVVAIGVGGWHVLTASWPLAVLSFTYAVRGLRPSYTGEKLSRTTHARLGTTFGPPALGGVALSLQPVRPTRFTDAVMRFYVAGWTLDGRTALAMLPAGLAWPSAILALVPGVPEPVHAVAGLLAGLLLVASLVLGVRAFRAGPGSTAPEADAGIAAMSATERARRLHELRRLRAERRRRGPSAR